MGRTQRNDTRKAPLGTDPSRASIGRYLSRERELRDISLDELSEITRLPKRSLERLEAGAYDDAADGFARGFVRTVSQALGLRPHEALAQMLPEASATDRGPRFPAWLPNWRVCAWLVAGLVAGGAVLFAGHRLLSGASEPSPVVYRTDVVRELWIETQRGTPLTSDVQPDPSDGPREAVTWLREPAAGKPSSAAD